MKRLVGIIISLAFIIAVSTVEIVLSDKYIAEIMDLSQDISQTTSRDNFTSEENVKKVQELDDMWTHHENILCLMTNHNNIDDVGQYITRMISSQRDQDYECFVSSLDLVIYYVEGYDHIFGITVQNLI